jgi:tetratricopeptide (TPR) repeat protein
MTRRARRSAVLATLVALQLAGAASVWAQPDPERLRTAKALFFDRKYAEAREAWQAIQVTGRGADAESAPFWIARCSENLGELERALAEYEAYLAARPTDRSLLEEARTSRVGLAARLYKAGTKQHLPILNEALADPSKTVRYFAALQLAGLEPRVGRSAVPVLRKILAEEKDDDLLARAKLALLRLEPAALAPTRDRPPSRSAVRAPGWIRVRIYDKSNPRPKVSVNLPVGLAELVFKSLPDEARMELRKKGYDADNFWERLKTLGPTEVVSIEGDDGERVQIWIE